MKTDRQVHRLRRQRQRLRWHNQRLARVAMDVAVYVSEAQDVAAEALEHVREADARQQHYAQVEATHTQMARRIAELEEKNEGALEMLRLVKPVLTPDVRALVEEMLEAATPARAEHTWDFDFMKGRGSDGRLLPTG